ncbi:MAG: peptidoglycan-binding domain-containing protein [bacterium]|nr:peptidoglycan-binding domain-containing protein [bacterium]
MRNNFLRTAVYTVGVSVLSVALAAIAFAPAEKGVKWVSREAQSAAVFFVESITAAQIRSAYHNTQFDDAALIPLLDPFTPAQSAGGARLPDRQRPTSGGKVRILIVPGHQPGKGGTVFEGVWEHEIVVDIADALAGIMAQNPHYEGMVARTKTAWNPVLSNYFDAHAADIEAFRQSQMLQMKKYLATGAMLPEADQVYHNAAPGEAALQLYGINKWASENEYDIIIHLHINDERGHRANVAGDDTGFTVYVPDHQYSNAAASKAVGEAIAARLNAYHATSTLPKEDKGVVEDQELIAIGSNNSVDGAALLIEYGYIYEPQFLEPSVRAVAVADYAYQTYLGLQDFFNDAPSATYGSIAFPYDWEKVTAKKDERGPGVYALQAALRYLGFYPPAGRSFSDCPVSGKAGTCTRSALMAFQRANGLAATGTLDPDTRDALFRDTEQSVTFPMSAK